MSEQYRFNGLQISTETRTVLLIQTENQLLNLLPNLQFDVFPSFLHFLLIFTMSVIQMDWNWGFVPRLVRNLASIFDPSRL